MKFIAVVVMSDKYEPGFTHTMPIEAADLAEATKLTYAKVYEVDSQYFPSVWERDIVAIFPVEGSFYDPQFDFRRWMPKEG